MNNKGKTEVSVWTVVLIVVAAFAVLFFAGAFKGSTSQPNNGGYYTATGLSYTLSDKGNTGLNVSPTTLLTSNNTWTGTNNFYGGSQLTDTLLLGTTVVSGNLQVNGNIILPLTITSVGMNITYASIPPYIIFLPIAGMSFTLPAPSASNNGQKFVIRRYGVGGGQTIIFNCVGNLAVWVPLNAGPTGNTTLAISSIWQFTIVSTGAVYLTIA